LRLTITSNFVGCAIERSAGFAPLKILSRRYARRSGSMRTAGSGRVVFGLRY
jgi:hypothetical protein